MKFYAGIGSRETPEDIGKIFTTTATILEARGFTLRSGGAEGADTFFERGVLNPDNKQIYLPWKDFNNSDSLLYKITIDAYKIAARFHPNWDRLSQGAQKLHARNCYQVLGYNLDEPAQFVMCWTEKGSGSGGTGQAIRIAKEYNIPVYDFGKLKF